MREIKLILIPVSDKIKIKIDREQQAISRRIRNHMDDKDGDYVIVVGEPELEYLKSIGRKLN